MYKIIYIYIYIYVAELFGLAGRPRKLLSPASVKNMYTLCVYIYIYVLLHTWDETTTQTCLERSQVMRNHEHP